MITQNNRTIAVQIDKQKFLWTLTALPLLIVFTFALVDTVASNFPPSLIAEIPPSDNGSAPAAAPAPVRAYPATGAAINPNLFALELPPPPLDALPYDIREPLSNGTSVPVKKRWLWIPPGEKIVVSETADGSLNVDIPVGSLWWKEFYIETDRGTFLIERRIVARTEKSVRNPEGWLYYSSHHLSPDANGDTPLIIPSTSDAAAEYMFQPTEWLPTKQESVHIEVRFEDPRGVQYPYVFPGQTQCMACHNGAAGAYPNADSDPVFVFGLHPNNLTPESFTALVGRGWITNGERLLAANAQEPDAASPETVALDTLTHQVVAVMRNNCASCHNESARAAANFTSFQIDPNYNYTTAELAALLGVDGRMVEGAFPLVTPGHLEQSELWLRINGLEGRRRMPPIEGGLPEIDPKVTNLIETWITQLDEQ